ncbi:hypothetical protein [Streptomyces sp. SLBN-31]|uniref:hypothetical protein n=1 Tax=Streptomyces sp. SLBN-31 TaxID=2768444 RepID=UPI001150787D|nr:hypothetical protein [Streptomyces sp. SLBN-31]TQJ87997.1 hypothetical protein FBY22_6854 [Streptomyces sp. SLBN-31]
MTKFIATVCLPPTKPRRLVKAAAAAMAPYDLSDARNPAGEWDWWAVHSEPGRGFLVLPAHDGDRRLLTPATVPRRKADLAPLGPLECHGGPRALLDFDAMRQRSAHRYDALRAAWEELAAPHPPARPLTEFVARHEADPEGYSKEDAKRDHLLQPLVQEVAQRAVAGDPHFDMSFLLKDPVAYFAQEHDAARRDAVEAAVPGFALLTLDGTWTDATSDGYWERANGYLDDLPGEAVVVDLLCHC